ncbi:MAG TPA: HD domain-containing protein, partial [Ignisphaera sp.]|nr:HD domain-containing protein [Ignisphaera sp.]
MGIPRSSTIFSTAKRIFDEVHGYVELSEAELKLIDTSIFQRLRYIKQLAVAWYVYPGATHTRFSHSIGTMYIMGLIAERLLNLGYIHSKEDVQLLRIAALLHDLGHSPFSHAIEPYYRERIGIGHEDITKMLILDNPEIKETLSYYGYDPKEIVAILEGKHREPLYNQLVSSDLDVDRMDYLLRDALHTGVAYGTIDIHRLITTIVVDGEGNLAILDKGIDALENFYIARLHMYRTVYYHKTLVGYELLLRKIYEKLAYEYSDELLLVSRAEVLNAIRSGIISFWNDSWLIGLIINALRDTRVSNMTKKLIRSFLIRRGYKVLLDKSRFEFKPLYI